MKTVLVIEDEDLIRINILTILQIDGYKTLDANNGQAGWELVLEHKPDLVISDVLMPEMSGLDVVRQMRSSEEVASTPIILLSGRVDTADVDAGMKLGATGYLIKPFRIPEFLEAVKKAIGAE